MSPSVLLLNTQENVVDLPSHSVTSSGSLITVIETSLQYKIINHYMYVATYVHLTFHSYQSLFGAVKQIAAYKFANILTV